MWVANEEKIRKAVEVAERFGEYDGEHHKTWVIDQMLRVLLGDRYQIWVADREAEIRRDDDPSYKWNVGVSP